MKIKILFDGRLLICSSSRNNKRSGIYFVVLNLLREFAKNENMEISLFYEYQMRDEMFELQKAGIIPKNCKIIDLNSLTLPIISFLPSFLYKLKKKYPKNSFNDNLVKKAIRFISTRVIRFFNKHIFYFTKLKKQAINYDVYFSPCHSIPRVIFNNNDIKSYMLVHDLIPYILKDFYNGYQSQLFGMRTIIDSINEKGKYFAVSESTKNDILKIKPNINPNKIVVTYNGVNENFYQETNLQNLENVKNKYNIPQNKKYIFSLCTLEPRKNLEFAINNFISFTEKCNINDIVYAIGGAAWEEYSDRIKNYQDRFIRLGYVEDKDLANLYSGAEMFVYPSLYEGFGMPVLEAMACGCPVITSNTSSLPEVIGECGIQINPTSDEEMIKAYEKMYFDATYREECRQKGLKRAKQFSWQKMAGIMYQTFVKDLVDETSF